LFEQAYRDWEQGVSVGVASRRFHLGLVRGLAELASQQAKATGTRVVGLSGGVMQNRTLARELPAALAAAGLEPLVHAQVPANDGCVSLGQAAWARLRLARGQ